MTAQFISACRTRPAEDSQDKRGAIRLRNRRAIIAAAGELATERGMAGVTVKDLAERAGVSRRTIFNHVPSAQDAVFEYLSEHVTGLVDRMLHELPPPGPSGGATLGEVYAQLAGALRAEPLLEQLRPVFAVDLQDTPAVSLWGFRVSRDAVRRLDEALVERLPQVTPFQVHLVSTTLINALTECLDTWLCRTQGVLDPASRAAWDQLLDEALVLLGRGFDD